MKLLAFNIPLECKWESNTDSELGMINGVDSRLTQQMILDKYCDVFTGLGNVEPIKIHL